MVLFGNYKHKRRYNVSIKMYLTIKLTVLMYLTIKLTVPDATGIS